MLKVKLMQRKNNGIKTSTYKKYTYKYKIKYT